MPKQLKFQKTNWSPRVNAALDFTSNPGLVSVALFLKDHPESYLKAVTDHLSEVTGSPVHRTLAGNYLKELVRLGIVEIDPDSYQPGRPFKYSLKTSVARKQIQSLLELFS